ncbi:hypothetical protein L798_15243 [Zootermopsis nevadensis]|uniref:Uncharacterized protein n=1 Tax=Zootermopsis nevadensis TaxID=136037 RepID=A0A067QPP5_ZOONE|nr:hypothetical protein L798_15243 [Zootermopsis nevadensis]
MVGVREGDAPSATLFNIALNIVLEGTVEKGNIVYKSKQICAYAEAPPAGEKKWLKHTQHGRGRTSGSSRSTTSGGAQVAAAEGEEIYEVEGKGEEDEEEGKEDDGEVKKYCDSY